jgi:PAS domain S-box-containing protein
MSIPIHILIIEDSEDDTLLVVRELKKNGYNPVFERVETFEAMNETITNREWDLIVADYSMPRFDALKALELKKEKKPDIPFILISGTIGEEIAVEVMKAGADDYIMKDKLARLVPAIKRELREAEERRNHKQAEDAIQTIVKGTVGTTGQDFFDNVVKSVCEWLGADYAFIGQIVDGNKVKALSAQIDGEIKCDCTCDLRDTICEYIIKVGYHICPDAGNRLFHKCRHFEEKIIKGYVGAPLRDKGDKPLGILWTASRNKLNLPLRTAEVMDIIAAKASSEIERMRAEEELKKSEQHHRRLLNSLKEGVYECETEIEGVFTWANQAFAEMFGYKSPESVIGTKAKDICVDPEDRIRLLEKLEKDGVYKNFESVCKKRNGEQFYTERTSNLIRDKEGKPVLIEGVVRDITERKQMEERIRQYNEDLEKLVEERTMRIQELERRRMQSEKLAATGRMVARVAHEINNPLAGIKNTFLLIKDAIPKDYKYYKYISMADKEIGRISRIVQQLFDLYRPYQERDIEFNVNMTIRETISMLESMCDEGEVSINLDIDKEPVMVTMTEDYLRQILFNIIRNSIEASPRGGLVGISVEVDREIMAIMVSDQGSGIPDELSQQIYEPFFSTKGKDSTGGLGLGLSTTKGIVEVMGGSIDFVSEKDKGTTFTIELPIRVKKETERSSPVNS